MTNIVGCPTPDDLWVKHVGTLVRIVDEQRAAVEGDLHDALEPHDDGDGDRLPDSAEPWLCQVENSNFPEDGSCDATLTDYTPPV